MISDVRQRSVALVLALGSLVAVSGCYTLQPVTRQTLPAGMTVSLNINDAARAALSSQMGPNISEIQGRLIQEDTAGYMVAVSEIRTFRDGTQVWSGEHVLVKKQFVNQVSERKFSRSRTAIVSVAAVGVLAILASQGILGSLSGDDGKPPVDTIVTSKIPLFIKR